MASPRKQRTDPVVPGLSVSNCHGAAGTLGCIVYDRRTGAPALLAPFALERAWCRLPNLGA